MSFRDPRNRTTGNVKLRTISAYVYVSPRELAERRDPRLKEFFAARLRGEPVSLPRSR